MALLNKRKLSDEIVSKINTMEASIAMTPGVPAAEVAHALGRRHALMTVYKWIDAVKEEELDAGDLLRFIESQKKQSYDSAFDIDDYQSSNYEVKKGLDFGKLTEYTAVSAHVKERNDKLESAE